MEAPDPTPEPEVTSGITPDSTAEGGNFAVPTGNTLYAPPPQRAPAPEEVKPYPRGTGGGEEEVTGVCKRGVLRKGRMRWAKKFIQ